MVEQGVGPIDYLVLEFPGARIHGSGFGSLAELVDRGIIRILDFRVARRTVDGLVPMALSDLDGDGGVDVAEFVGLESNLLGDEDLAEGAALVAAGSAVGVLVYESSWATPFVAALHETGAEVVVGGRVPETDAVTFSATASPSDGDREEAS